MRKVWECSLRWRLLRCLCLLLVSSILLLNTSIESRAQETLNHSYGQTFNNNDMYGSHFTSDFGAVNLYPSANSSTYYEVVLDFNFSSVATTNVYLRNVVVKYGDIYLTSFVNGDEIYSTTHSVGGQISFVARGSSLLNNSFIVEGRNMLDTYVSGRQTFNNSFTYNLISCTALSSSESSDYENGYNAGYSDGETDGYDNGYSQGYLDGEESGFQAGQESVDTQSYYDAGYQAGYRVAYSDGYESGYAEGLKSVQSSPGSWGAYKFIGSPILNQKKYGSSFYISPFGLDDMEEYQNGSNGYYHNTVPTVYDGYSIINYLIPLDGVTQIDSDTFSFEMTLSSMYSGFDIDTGSGSFKNSLLSSEIEEVYLTFNGRKYYGNVGKYSSGSQGFCNFSFIVESDVSPTELNYNSIALSFLVHNRMFASIDAGDYKFVGGVCSPYVGFDLGSSAQGYSFRVRPYIENDRVSANIQNQTDVITGALEEQKEVQQSQLEEQKEQTETQKGIWQSIKDFFGSFFDNLINSIIHIFVPTKEEMSELFDRLNDFFAETFGFLYYPFDFIIDAFNIFLETDSETGLTLPGFSIMGHEVWGNQTYDIASEPIVGTIFGYVRMGTGAMLAMWFVNYLRNFFDKRFGGGGN